MFGSERYGLDPRLVLAVIEVESSWQNHPPGSDSATGLMQVETENGTATTIAKELGVAEYDLNDVSTNIRFGVHLLAQLCATYQGDLHTVLTAYNRGESGVILHMQQTGSAVSMYSTKVLLTMSKFD